MSAENEPTVRVVEQRVRDRVMENLELLAEGDAAVHRVGAKEYFNQFFDWIDDDAPSSWRTLSVFTEDEVTALAGVHDVMAEACETTPMMVTQAQLVATGWPARVQRVAVAALQLVSRPGRFSEAVEEVEPAAADG